MAMARSSPLVVVADLDGFQHGPDAFTPKCLAMACDRLEFSMEWQFNTGALASRSPAHISTYYSQSQYIHGLPLTSPGLPQALFPQVFSHTLAQVLFEALQVPAALSTPDHMLLFTKGQVKLDLFRRAVQDISPFLELEFRDLTDLNCPTIMELAPETRGRIVSTKFKAIHYAIWLSEQGLA